MGFVQDQRPEEMLQRCPSSPSCQRRRKRDSSDWRDDDGSDTSEHKRSKGQTPNPNLRQRHFACPFYVAYPSRVKPASACAKHGWSEISRLKEHLYRCHRRISCERCFTSFDTETDLQCHRRQVVPCQIVYSESRDAVQGIDHIAMRELKSRKRLQGQNERAKWFEIWRILFPKLAAPDSPYAQVDTAMQSLEPQVIDNFEEFMSSHFDDKVAGPLEKCMRGTELDAALGPEHMREVLWASLRHVFQLYRHNMSGSTCASSAAPSPEISLARLLPSNSTTESTSSQPYEDWPLYPTTTSPCQIQDVGLMQFYQLPLEMDFGITVQDFLYGGSSVPGVLGNDIK